MRDVTSVGAVGPEVHIHSCIASSHPPPHRIHVSVMLSLFSAPAGFSTTPTPEPTPEPTTPVLGALTCESPNFTYVPMANDKYERTNARITCEEAAHVYEAECCGVDAAETNFPTVKFDDDMCFLPAGTHLAQTEAFSGTKIEAVVTASECAPTLAQWQNSPQNPVGQHCAIGAFDGLNVMPILNDGTMSSLSDGAAVARAFINTELSGRTGADYSPKWYVSICEESGGFGQPEPTEECRLMLTGAAEQFFDFDRSSLEAVNAGHAVRKIYTMQTGKVQYNQPFDGSLKSGDIYGLITEHRQLFANVQASQAEMASPNCDEAGSAQCGLYGHCGSKLALKHEFSYRVNGAPAYGATEGVGFEDDVLLISMEGHPIGDGVRGTINALDVRTGDWYPLPQLAVGTVEMAFTISTGHPDWIAVGIQDYGSEVEGCGSGWNVWIGKKDKTATHFLDRNGLGPNQGRIYRVVDPAGETDMATFMEWPASGRPDYNFVPKAARLEPIELVFDGSYATFNADAVNCASTVQGSTPIRMTGVDKQEWGSVNPDKPNQWAMAETGLGLSVPACVAGDDSCPIGRLASTAAFLEAQFLEKLTPAALAASTVTSRNGAKMPDFVNARLFHVLADQVFIGPNRYASNSRGYEYVDSLLWLKGGKVLLAEDAGALGEYNMAVIYDPATRKTVPIAGALGNDNHKMNTVNTVPYGSFDRPRDQEMTGFYDWSAAMSVAVPYTPQDIYDALDGKHVVVNNQMKGYYQGCMSKGFHYTAQMMSLILPDIDWATTPLAAPSELTEAGESLFVSAYGKYRRRSLAEKRAIAKTDVCADACDWKHGHDDYDLPCCH